MMPWWLAHPLVTWMLILLVVFLLALFTVTITNEQAKELPPP